MYTGVDVAGVRTWRPACLLALSLLVALEGGGAATASLPLLLAVPGGVRDTGGLVAAIGLGALVLGTAGWAGATVLDAQVSVVVAAGLGIAAGGGIGAVVWLLAVGEAADRGGRETVAVEMNDDERAGPEPQPADLFAESPDPIVFFAGEEPVVRAVNPAYEETFGVSSGVLDGADLEEALMSAEPADDVVAAVRTGGSYDRTVACEAAEGTRRMRLRLVVTEDPVGASGYLVYTPVESGET